MIHPIRSLDKLLNDITLYRLVVYGLGVIVAVAVAFGFMDVLAFSGWSLLASVSILVAVCYATNHLLAISFGASPNSESWLITALILACILAPVSTIREGVLVALVGGIAMASKYVIAYHAKHLFNPAALAAEVVGVSGLVFVSWWVGSTALLPFTVVVGLLIVRKARRFRLVSSFIAVSLVTMLVVGLVHDRSALTILTTTFTSWPLVFLGCIMLTEPSTLPPHRGKQLIYAGMVGVIFASQQHVGSIASTPALALLVGNLYAYIVSAKAQLRLRLLKRTQIAPHVHDFSFAYDHQLTFRPGQYMEWTLPHRRADNRGNRRTFTIASAPGEATMHIGIKTYEHPSSFKTALLAMKEGDELMAGHVSGNFTLPSDESMPLLGIAGGIGITPFRSMVQDLTQTKRSRDFVLIYLVSDKHELAYMDIFAEAARYGVRVVPVAAETLTAEMVKREVPNYAQRRVYISGPSAMVENYRELCMAMHIPSRSIVTDFFSGY